MCYWEGDSQRKVGVLEVAEDLRLGKQKPQCLFLPWFPGLILIPFIKIQKPSSPSSPRPKPLSSHATLNLLESPVDSSSKLCPIDLSALSIFSATTLATVSLQHQPPNIFLLFHSCSSTIHFPHSNQDDLVKYKLVVTVQHCECPEMFTLE